MDRKHLSTRATVAALALSVLAMLGAATVGATVGTDLVPSHVSAHGGTK